MNWHQKEIDRVFADLESSPHGISSGEAQTRLRSHGPNLLREKDKKGPVAMFLEQFSDFLILILIAAAIVSGILGELSDTLAIAVIILVNAILGFVQEYRAEKALAALKKMAAPSATVMRDGMPVALAASELVPGDVVVLEAGMIVPADVRLAEAVRLKVDEAALTGESLPVEKHTETVPEEKLPLGDRKNMAYKGTTISYGRGVGVVVSTGMDTEIGRIAAMLQEGEEGKTPLQKRLTVFGRRLGMAVLVICAVIFVIGILRGEPPLVMLLTAVSLAVAAIPEALPAVVTISLALGSKKLVRQNALIRKLPAVETLGSVTYICSDKTGTLTVNRMKAEDIYVDGRKTAAAHLTDEDLGQSATAALMTTLAISNDARPDKTGRIIGDPTEVSLYEVARNAGFLKEDLDAEYSRIAEIPFDSVRKCMTTIHKWPEGRECKPLIPAGDGKRGCVRYISITKGAAEVILERSADVLKSAGIERLDKEEIRKAGDGMAALGLRVLAVGVRFWDRLPDTAESEPVEVALTFLGLVGMIDPPREGAADSVASCKSAGIRPVMITGDHPLTARAMALRLGILEAGTDAVMTGKRLEELPLKEFEEVVEDVRVYARVAPEQKLKIIKALQDRGQFVAMTGDGVNDAPALRRADIGVSMGITGTDVSKEASHMILLDDNFATIVGAVKEGRRIYDNIRKFVKYLLTTNSGEIWTLFLAPLFGLPIPLLPIHILWVNLMTDGLPALALSVEPAEADVMKRPPRSPRESIFSHGLGVHAVWVGLLMAGIVLSAQTFTIRTGVSHWQTIVFTVLCLSQLGHAMAIRSERQSLFTIGLLSNKALIGAVALSVAFQMMVIYMPVLNPVFKTQPLSPLELVVTFGLSSLVFVAVEVEKWRKRRRAEL